MRCHSIFSDTDSAKNVFLSEQKWPFDAKNLKKSRFFVIKKYFPVSDGKFIFIHEISASKRTFFLKIFLNFKNPSRRKRDSCKFSNPIFCKQIIKKPYTTFICRLNWLKILHSAFWCAFHTILSYSWPTRVTSARHIWRDQWLNPSSPKDIF